MTEQQIRIRSEQITKATGDSWIHLAKTWCADGRVNEEGARGALMPHIVGWLTGGLSTAAHLNDSQHRYCDEAFAWAVGQVVSYPSPQCVFFVAPGQREREEWVKLRREYREAVSIRGKLESERNAAQRELKTLKQKHSETLKTTIAEREAKRQAQTESESFANALTAERQQHESTRAVARANRGLLRRFWQKTLPAAP